MIHLVLLRSKQFAFLFDQFIMGGCVITAIARIIPSMGEMILQMSRTTLPMEEMILQVGKTILPMGEMIL